MSDDINKKQEKPFLNQEQESRGENFKSKIEIPQTPEQPEVFKAEVKKDILEEKEDEKEGELNQGNLASIGAKKQIQDEREKKIERILEKDMDDIYLGASLAKRQELKKVGEKTANQINQMIDKGKLKFKKVIDLIKKWFLIIPGVNRFFLEQEAKLKTDEIMKLAEDKSNPQKL